MVSKPQLLSEDMELFPISHKLTSVIYNLYHNPIESVMESNIPLQWDMGEGKSHIPLQCDMEEGKSHIPL